MIKLYNEDCLVGMKRIESNSVDMILTDLPFGITDAPFDKRVPFSPMWEQFLRVIKANAAILLFSQMPFGSDLIQSQRKLFRYEWIWEKSLACGFLNAKKMPLRCHENILVFYRKLPTYNPQFTKGEPYTRISDRKSANYSNGKRFKQPDVINREFRYPVDYQSFRHEKKHHPTQKPTALLEYLIKTYTNEGEVVLDATMGSGSTGVAAINTGRKFIGFELEQKFFDIAERRIAEAVAKREQSLF